MNSLKQVNIRCANYDFLQSDRKQSHRRNQLGRVEKSEGKSLGSSPRHDLAICDYEEKTDQTRLTQN